MGWKADYKVKDIYDDLQPEGVDYRTFAAFITECNEALMFAMIDENLTLSLPSMGYLSVQKHKPKILRKDGTVRKRSMKVNFGETWKLWRSKWPDLSDQEIKALPDKPLVYHTNKHTDGYVFKFIWDKFTSSMTGKSFYKLKPAREFTRHLSKQLKEGNVDFFETGNNARTRSKSYNHG